MMPHSTIRHRPGSQMGKDVTLVIPASTPRIQRENAG